MSPLEARNAENLSRVRMFKAADLSGQAAGQRWDRVRVVCSQPFSKTLKCGLSFVNLSSPEGENGGKRVQRAEKINAAAKEASPVGFKRLGAFKLKDEEDEGLSPLSGTSSIGKLFARKKLLSTSGGESPTSVAAQARYASQMAITLASKELGRKPGDEANSERPTFYQLKKARATKKKTDITPKRSEVTTVLPRRDVPPGEDDLWPKRDSSDGKRRRRHSSNEEIPPSEKKKRNKSGATRPPVSTTAAAVAVTPPSAPITYKPLQRYLI